MTPTPHAPIFGLLGIMLLVAMAAGGPAPAGAQSLPVVTAIKPGAARWLDQWLGMRSGGDFVLAATTESVVIARLNQPRRFRICVTATSVGQDVGVTVATEGAEVIVPVDYCAVLEGRQVVVAPSEPLDGTQQVRGFHEIIG